MIRAEEANGEEWLLWMLADSALPVGGFVASAGLEAAVQLGHVAPTTSSSSLAAFARASIHSIAASCLPVIGQVHNIVSSYMSNLQGSSSTQNDRGSSCAQNDQESSENPNPNTDLLNDTVERISALDRAYDAFAGSNHVARRASIAQGAAYLSLITRSFTHTNASDTPESPNRPGTALITALKHRIRIGTVPGHLPICFATACTILTVSHTHTASLFLFLHTRAIISAAIRLNLIGPYAGQSLLLHLRPFTESLTRNHDPLRGLSVPRSSRVCGDCVDVRVVGAQTSPWIDLMQGSHDQLYSRIFNS